MTVAMDAMAVAIHIKYALSLKRHITFYWRLSRTSGLRRKQRGLGILKLAQR